MLSRLVNIGIFSFMVFQIISCSTTKKSVFNKEYHALTTKFNVLFNGKEAFNVGQSILSEAFEDNFYDILPVEPINLRGENIEETTIVPGFDRAEEKAVKAIQKHSIKINDIQYNRQINKAYLLLGKARYFDRRFFPALEAFNFLLESEVKPENYIEGRIWREKTNIRLKNLELAIQNLRPLALSLISKSKFYSLANATLAEAFINLKQLDSAAFYITRAAINEPKRKNKARYLFIAGQLFEELQKSDSAKWAYSDVISLKRKAPRKFWVQAKIKESILDTTTSSQDHIENLKKLLNNYENQTFEHYIYRALGALYFKKKKDSIALDYFDRSLKSIYLNSYTQIKNYNDLIDYHFNKGNYLISGTYLENLLPLFNENTIAYKKLKRKRDNLSEVIFYEKTIKETDSLIRLFSLSSDEQLSYFKKYIYQKQERQAMDLEKQNEERKFQILNSEKTSFYFYNSNQILKGRQNYLAKWGNRPNVDNWRNATAILNTDKLENVAGNLKTRAITIIKETPESYVSLIPKSKTEKDSIILVNQKAYLQLGMIYKEKFNDFLLAHSRLEKVITLKATDEITVQALYHLFRMDEFEDPKTANLYKRLLIDNYPETAFARFLNDPDNYDASSVVTPETLYLKAFNFFENQKFSDALKQIELLSVLASGSQIEPKISLLKAHVLGRINGVEFWKKALTKVATNYSAVEEGIQAKSLVDQINLFDNLKEKGKIYKNYKWVFPFLSVDSDDAQSFFIVLNDVVNNYNKRWNVSIDIYNEKYLFVVVHGIRDLNKVVLLKNQKELKEDKFVNKENFVTLASQYRDYIKNKTWIKIIK